MSIRSLYSARTLGRLVSVKRCSVNSASYLLNNKNRALSTVGTVRPEDIIQDCSKIRESIQALNDVSRP